MKSATFSKDLIEAQRPFKTFLSLMDKWEVGSALSAALAIPALQAIKSISADQSTIAGEEVS